MPTAVAPRASAFRTSVPRRTPPSMSTGMRPPTASTASTSTPIVACPLSSARPPWLETMRPSTPWRSESLASSPVMMPFSTSLPFDDRAQAIDEFPRHAGAVEVRDLGNVDAGEIGLAADLVGEARLVTARAVAQVQAPLAEQVL